MATPGTPPLEDKLKNLSVEGTPEPKARTPKEPKAPKEPKPKAEPKAKAEGGKEARARGARGGRRGLTPSAAAGEEGDSAGHGRDSGGGFRGLVQPGGDAGRDD